MSGTYDFGGPVEGAVSSLTDLFSRKLVDRAGCGLIAVNTQGLVLLANPAARSWFGVLPGASLEKRLPPLWDKVRDLLGGGEAGGEIPLREGAETYLARVEPVFDEGELVGAACSFAENTPLGELAGRMRAHKEISRELDAIIENSPDGIWVCDGEARVLRLNRASERINGITAEMAVGRNMQDLVGQGFVDRSVTLEVLKTGETVHILQQRADRKLMLTGTPVRDSEGKLIRVVASERDITEIDNLQRDLEEQEAIKNRFRLEMQEMQQIELESRQVIAKSPCMVRALSQALKVAGVNSSLLILGESGVGKGLFADLVHHHSGRAEKPVIKINCGAIPESLIESELFGHEKGAFTGAQGSKAGYFEMADGGTLFLDEIAELPLSSQVKLLRFLEDGSIMRLGGTRGRKVDVRILAATHRDLERMVEEGTFRLDLYYRLNVIPIMVPAVRERRECILPLIRHFVEDFCAENGIKKRLTRAASDALLAYSYPGNVRELMNICERLVVMTETELVDVRDLPAVVLRSAAEEPLAAGGWPEEMALQQILDSVERQVLLEARERHGNQVRMAEVLGVNQSTVARKLKRYGLT